VSARPTRTHSGAGAGRLTAPKTPTGGCARDHRWLVAHDGGATADRSSPRALSPMSSIPGQQGGAARPCQAEKGRRFIA